MMASPVRLGALGVEALRVARPQPATTVVTVLIAGLVAGVILATTGQTVQQEQQVLARIDDAGTRSIVIADTEGRAGITPEAVDRIASLDGIEWVVGFGPAMDGRNSHLDQAGSAAAFRRLYGSLPSVVAADPWDRRSGTALVGPVAQRTLGLPLPVGSLTASDSSQLTIVGAFRASEPLTFLNRSVIVAADTADFEAPVRSIHILTRRPEDVSAISDAAVVVLGAQDLASVGVQTSETLADIRSAVKGELGSFGRRLVTIVLLVGLGLVALNLYGAVTARRRDFGRRRALGASRPAIIGLIVAQTLFVALLGAALGASAGTALVWNWTGAAPDWPFTASIIILTVLASAAASFPVAAVAAYRDPLTVLRIP